MHHLFAFDYYEVRQDVPHLFVLQQVGVVKMWKFFRDILRKHGGWCSQLEEVLC